MNRTILSQLSILWRVATLLFCSVGWLSAAPTIDQQPQSASVVKGETALLTVSATGTGSLNFAWYRGESGDVKRLVTTGPAASLTTPVLQSTTSYWVRVTDETGSVDSATATITVVSARNLIAKGFEYLLAPGRQSANGSWDEHPGVTAMVVLALLNGGYSEDPPSVEEPPPAPQSPVSKGIAYLLSRLSSTNVTIGGETLPAKYISGDTTYTTSMAVMALVATRNPAYTETIRQLRDYMLYSQSTYNGSFSYGVAGGGSGDMSNSQWGFFALRSAEGVLRDGKGDAALQRARTYMFNSQRLSLDAEGNYISGDGIGGYQIGSYGSFDRCTTSALVWSYALAGIGPEDIHVRKGLEWLTNNYSWDYGNARYYNIVTFSKALVMSHKTKLGDRDWFVDMVKFLRDRQTAEGYWVSYQWLDGHRGYGDNRMINTAWAILSMQTRTLPENVNATMSIILASHADVHLYDTEGRHTGKNYETGQLDNQIPNAQYLLYLKDENGKPSGDPLPWPADGVLLEEWAQVINLPLAEAGTYRIELIGTSDGPFDLTVQGAEDGQVVTTETTSGSITKDAVLTTNVTVTALEGSTTLLYEPIRSLPVMTVEPSLLVLDPASTDAQTFNLTIRETGGMEDLVGVNITKVISGAIGGATVTFTKNNFTVAKGTTETVTATITLPAALTLPVESGSIRVESAGGGTRVVKVSPLPVFTLNRAEENFDANGGSGSVEVTATSVTDADWRIVFANPADQSWIVFTSGTAGTGSATINYSVAAGGGNRSAELTIAGQPFRITQTGSSTVEFSIAPTEASYGPAGGSGQVAVTVKPSSQATWIVVCDVDWVSFPNGPSARGSGPLDYQVAPFHRTGQTRQTIITVAGHSFTITQNGIASLAGYLNGMTDLGGGQMEVPGFGTFDTFAGTFWVYHSKLGWEYLDGPGGDLIICGDPELGWVATTGAIYPYLYRYRDGLWYFFMESTSQPGARYFYRYNGSVWENYGIIP